MKTKSLIAGLNITLLLFFFVAEFNQQSLAQDVDQQSKPLPPFALKASVGGNGSESEDLDYPAPLLSLSFDTKATKSNLSNVLAVTATGIPLSMPGKFGQAIRVTANDYLNIKLKQALNLSSGTISIWVKPIDWESDNLFHEFVELGKSDKLLLYKYYQSNWTFLQSRSVADGGSYKVGERDIFKKGVWTHLAATWTQNQIQLYVDGKPVSKAPAIMRPLGSLGSLLVIGDRNMGRSGERTTGIDELKVFNVALSPERIKQLYINNALDSKRSFKDLAVALGSRPLGDGYELSLDASTLVTKNPLVLTLKINNKVVKKFKVSAGSPKLDYLIDKSELKSGVNNIEVSCDGVGVCFEKTVEHLDTNYVMPVKQKSLELTAGNSGFTAENKLFKYEFDSSGMLSGVKSDGIELLSGGMSLVVTKYGVESGCSLLNSSLNGSAEVTSTFDCLGDSKPDVSVAVKVNDTEGVQYSVKSLNDFSLGWNGEEIKVRIPLNGAMLEAQNFWSPDSYGNTSLIQQGQLIRHSYIPYIWMGGAKAGLFWYSSERRYAPASGRKDFLTIQKKEDSGFFELLLDNPNWKNKKYFNVSFGLLPTSSKNKSKIQRSLALYPSKSENLKVLWPRTDGNSVKYIGLFNPDRPFSLKEYIKNKRLKGQALAPYFCPTFISTQHPAWVSLQNEYGGTVDSTSIDVRQFGGSFALIKPESAVWQQVLINNISAAFKDYGFKYIYFDNVMTYPYQERKSADPNASYQNADDFHFKSLSALYDNVRAIVRSNNAKSIAHMSGNMNELFMQYFDAIVVGEQFRGKVSDDYLKLYSLGQFRAEFDPNYRGKSTIFLPQFSGVYRDDPAAARRLMALLLIHDIGIWPQWINVETVDKVVSRLKGFGYENSDFYPYYSEHPIVSSNNKNIKISVYMKGKDYLLVASNLGYSDESGKACINLPGSNNLNVKWKDSDGWSLGGDSECIQGLIKPGDFKLIEAEVSNN